MSSAHTVISYTAMLSSIMLVLSKQGKESSIKIMFFVVALILKFIIQLRFPRSLSMQKLYLKSDNKKTKFAASGSTQLFMIGVAAEEKVLSTLKQILPHRSLKSNFLYPTKGKQKIFSPPLDYFKLKGPANFVTVRNTSIPHISLVHFHGLKGFVTEVWGLSVRA